MRARSIVLAAILGAASCHKPPPAPQAFQTGKASWYGGTFNGRQTASGEIFDTNQLTAAHRLLPFQTQVRVEDLVSGKTVQVRINDRGPYVAGRILDVTHQAAETLGFLPQGVADVKLIVVSRPKTRDIETYAVQVAMTPDGAEAERLRARYASEFQSAQLVMRDAVPPMWRVLVGREPSLERAEDLRRRIGGNPETSLVVRLDE